MRILQVFNYHKKIFFKKDNEKEECLKKASLYLDTLAFEFETELAYESMITILEGRQ